MVKNSGGKRCKSRAAKHTGDFTRQSMMLPSPPSEQVALVLNMHGPHCTVLTTDGIQRTCMIRKKFRGRNKRQNFITKGSWVLVGLREFSSETVGGKNKLAPCDLLSTYSDANRSELISTFGMDDFASFFESEHETFDVRDITFDKEVLEHDNKSSNSEEALQCGEEVCIDDI